MCDFMQSEGANNRRNAEGGQPDGQRPDPSAGNQPAAPSTSGERRPFVAKGPGLKKIIPSEEEFRLHQASGDVREKLGRLFNLEDIQETCDLHECVTKNEAVSRFEVFIARARERGLHTVQVITGKGVHSVKKTPRLRMEIEGILNEMAIEKEIFAFRRQEEFDRDYGAFIIQLYPVATAKAAQ